MQFKVEQAGMKNCPDSSANIIMEKKTTEKTISTYLNDLFGWCGQSDKCFCPDNSFSDKSTGFIISRCIVLWYYSYFWDYIYFFVFENEFDPLINCGRLKTKGQKLV